MSWRPPPDSTGITAPSQKTTGGENAGRNAETNSCRVDRKPRTDPGGAGAIGRVKQYLPDPRRGQSYTEPFRVTECSAVPGKRPDLT